MVDWIDGKRYWVRGEDSVAFVHEFQEFNLVFSVEDMCWRLK